ncbi:MAG TPA: hypothetical protein VGG03_18660 [Thermoanaerobaculia bacterium]|jgi:hypothetical protein
MSGFDDWYLYGDSLARCLVAVAPEFASSVFEDVMTRTESLVPSPASNKGSWYHALKGYIHMDPEGGHYHYQREPPAGVPPDDMGDAGVRLSDRLVREMDHFLATLQAAGAGEPVQMRERDGQPVTIQASGDDLARLHALAETLKRTRDACQPGYNRAVTSQIHAAILERLPAVMATGGGQPQAVVDLVRAGAAGVLDLRWRYEADARLTALFFVQSRLCELALQQLNSGQLSTGTVLRLASRSIEGRGVAHDPEQMLAQIVVDFASAGLGELVLNLCNEALSSAEGEVDAALNAADLSNHAGHLYSAAHFAFAGMRLAETFRECVALHARPAQAKDDLLEGYARNAEEIVVRSGHALVVDCINRGSGQMLELHIREVRAARQEGGLPKAQSKVEELTNYLYFYPRYYVKVLMEEVS